MRKTNDIFEKRLAKHMDELRWLYMELYDNEAMFAELCEQMQNYYHARNAKLRKRDLEKEKDQAWYRKKNMLGMMLYIDNFAGNLRGVKGKLKYLEECGVNCVHLMPFLDSPKGRSDGGYAVADFRKVKPELGTIEDLADLAEACHEKDMNLCMICQYLGASDCKLQEGSMRADVNLSVREVGASEFGTRTEMKNLNSFKAITHAIEGERQRQIELIEEGKKVIQETRRWDDNKEYSYAMRSKEDAQDYRYFPEPDLVPIVISDEWIQKIKDQQPELRSEKLARYEKDYDIPRYDAELITGTKKMADLFEATCAICNKPKKVSNWLMVETMRLLNENGQEPADIKFSPENLAKLIELADAGTINSSVAKEVFEKVFAEDVDPEKYVEDHGLKTVNDEGALRTLAEEVIAKNPKAVEDFKGGKEKALGALVGQIMKAMKGKANPGMVNELLREMLK